MFDRPNEERNKAASVEISKKNENKSIEIGAINIKESGKDIKKMRNSQSSRDITPVTNLHSLFYPFILTKPN